MTKYYSKWLMLANEFQIKAGQKLMDGNFKRFHTLLNAVDYCLAKAQECRDS